MKTSTNLTGWILLCSFLLLNLVAKAQDYPYPGDLSPIYSGNTVDCGLLQNPDQKTTPIWFKVSGKMANPQPQNKLHNPANATVAGSYVHAGDYVDVNFNVNKNVANRYTLVTYTVNTITGVRTIFDYQSNIYNASPPSPPVQGNSNQQRVLTPTNCPFEIYWVKGCLVSTFTATGPNSLTTGPVGNPYSYDAGGNLLSNNLILGYTFGDAAPNTVCDKCPTVVNGTNNQVSTQLLEVIDLPATQEKELIFSVINLNGTTVAPLTDFQLIGDVIFSGITPTHTKNNMPYAFRSDYQLGPVIPNYTVPGPQGFGPKDAFVFDQRNNHNILAYDTYQSEIFRFKVSYAEYARLSGPNPSPQPEVCVELSPKHPEPHLSLPPIYCANINFNCNPQPCDLITDTDCFKEDCCFSVELFGSQLGVGGPGTYSPFWEVTNTCGESVTSITYTTPEMATDPAAAERVYDITATNSLLTFANPVPPFDTIGSSDQFIYVLSTASVEAPGGGLVTVTITTSNGATHSFNFDLLNQDPNCGIIPLPVELISFDGRLSGEDIALNWKTATEENNDRFEIERSADGRKFEKIGSVKGSGNSSNTLEYGFLDKDPNKGINYYRLNQVDLDGTASHSKIIKLNTNDKGSGPVVQLIPNPCNGESCTVHLKGFTSANKLTVELRDLTGRMIFSKQVNSDQTSFELPRVTTGNGVYILSARDGNHTTYQKVVIQ